MVGTWRLVAWDLRHLALLSRLALGIMTLVFTPSNISSAQTQCSNDDVYRLKVALGSAFSGSSSGLDVILIHGLWVDQYLHSCEWANAVYPDTAYFHTLGPDATLARWKDLVDILNARRVRVWTWRWPSYLSIKTAGENLKAAVAAEGLLANHKLVLVGHSMGGLVALQSLTDPNSLRGNVIRTVTLGTPHNGIPAADILLIAGFLGIRVDAFSEVTPNSTFLDQLLSQRTDTIGAMTYVIGGATTNSCLNDYLPQATLPGLGDCIVSLSSAYNTYNAVAPDKPVMLATITRCGFGPAFDYYSGYNHHHMALDYTVVDIFDGMSKPRDSSQGADLVKRVKQLLLPVHGDLNCDGVVDVRDLGILLSNWRNAQPTPADINLDHIVNVLDLGSLLSNWGCGATTSASPGHCPPWAVVPVAP